MFGQVGLNSGRSPIPVSPSSNLNYSEELFTAREMSEEDTEPLIEMRDISKAFGRIQALDGVDLTLYDKEILGLLGDNGSGKSTLVKTLVGIHDPDGGEIRVRGEPVNIGSPKDARKHGIATVYQDLALVDALSVAENMFLGRKPVRRVGGVVPIVDYDRMQTEAERILRERLNIKLDPTTSVEYLSGGERQAVAIGRALVTNPEIVVMDEPTSALSADSAQRVRDLIRNLREEGMAVIMISHDLDEVFTLTDRITVLENGKHAGTVETAAVDRDDVLRMMMAAPVDTGADSHEQGADDTVEASGA